MSVITVEQGIDFSEVLISNIVLKHAPWCSLLSIFLWYRDWWTWHIAVTSNQ